MPDIQLAVMSLAWGNPSGPNLDTFLEEAGAAGYDGVTGFADAGWEAHVADPDDFGRRLADHDLSLCSMDVKVHRDLDAYRRTCDFMSRLDCRHLVCLGGVGTTVETYIELADVLNPIGEVALEYGIRAAYHNGRTRETFSDVSTVLEHVDPEKVFAVCDLGHATRDFVELPYEERAIRFLETFWDRIDFLEFKDFSEETELCTPVGEGLCDWDRVFPFLKEREYTGWILVEQNPGDFKGRTPVECAALSREFIRRGLGV